MDIRQDGITRYSGKARDIFKYLYNVDDMLKDEGYQWTVYYNSTKEIMPYSYWRDSYDGLKLKSRNL